MSSELLAKSNLSEEATLAGGFFYGGKDRHRAENESLGGRQRVDIENDTIQLRKRKTLTSDSVAFCPVCTKRTNKSARYGQTSMYVMDIHSYIHRLQQRLPHCDLKIAGYFIPTIHRWTLCTKVIRCNQVEDIKIKQHKQHG